MTSASVPNPGARARPRTIIDRLLAVFPVLALAFAVFVFYAVEAWTRKTPWVFSDELEWTQLSRSIATTGHAARREQPIFFKSLYVYVIAPFWWIHSTTAAYAAVKYANAIVMPLAAVPTYLLARMLVSRRSSVIVALLSVSIPAMAYLTSIIPEVLFYPYYALCSWLVVRAFRSGKRLDIAFATVAVLGGYLIKEAESTTLPAAFLLAGAGLWVTGPRGREFRKNWTRGDTIGAITLLFGASYLFNRVVLQHVHEWQFTTQYVKGRMLDLGLQAALAFSMGLGILPVIGGLASLRLPERRGDPTYRAFAAWAGASVVTVSVYAALKSAYLSTNFGTLVEERNMFYLSPLMLIGTALVAESRRIDWRIVAAASALVAYIVLVKPFQTEFPYFEAPGFSIAGVLHDYRAWSVHQERLALIGVLALSVIALAARRVRGVAPIAAFLLLAWLLAGEISMTDGGDQVANGYRSQLPAQLGWVDAAAHGQPVTYIGQDLTSAGQFNLWETEFWNRSIEHVDSIDGSAPGPGPTGIPTLLSPTGLLADYNGESYVLADSGIDIVGKIVAHVQNLVHGVNMRLYRIRGPWHLLQADDGVYSDNWCSKTCAFTYYAPDQKGILEVSLGRLAYTGSTPPGRAVMRVGTVGINYVDQPRLEHVYKIVHTLIQNGTTETVAITVKKTPVRVVLTIPNPIPQSSHPNDPRVLTAQVGFTFCPQRQAGARGKPAPGCPSSAGPS